MAYRSRSRVQWFRIRLSAAAVIIALTAWAGVPGVVSSAEATTAPTPLLRKSHPVDWWFVFKFNTKAFPKCGDGAGEERQCPFGGDVQDYAFGQQFVYAS